MAVKDSEWGILACIIKDQTTIAECEAAGLGGGDFKDPLYRYLYSKILKMFSDDPSRKIDEVTLRQATAEHIGPLLSDAGISNKQLFDNLFTSHISIDNSQNFIEDVMENSLKLALHTDLKTLSAEGKDLASEELLARLEDLTQGAYKRINRTDVETIGGGSGLFKMIESRESLDIAGIATPWPTLNDRLSGLAPGGVTIWMSPTGTGKTTSMVSLCNHVCITNQIPGLMIGTEMPTEPIILKLVASRSGIKERQLRLNKDWQKTDGAIAAVKKACYDIDQTDAFKYLLLPDFTISKIRGHAIRAQMRYGIKFLIFDYLSEPADSDQSRSEWQNLSQFVWRMHVLATQLNIHIIITCQTTITANKETLTLMDTALGKYINFHVDNTIGVINKTQVTLLGEKSIAKNLGNQKLYIMKARMGGEERGLKDDTFRYINFNHEREICRVTEGASHHPQQYKD